MDKNLLRAYLLELLGSFALVFFGAGIVCVNHLATPAAQQPGTSVLLGHQPGLVGIALAQGLILTVVLAATMHRSGGYLNPAITLMLWVFNRLESVRASWLMGAQLLGAVLAGLALRCTFAEVVLREARLGTPHLNPSAYPEVSRGSLLSGTGIEFVLTFFLVFAIFGTFLEKARWRPGGQGAAGPADAQENRSRTLDARLAALVAGLALTACVLLGYPLTGAATNPARWFGTVFWEWTLVEPAATSPGPFADLFVYLAGPILGALLAGAVYFKVILLLPQEPSAAADTAAAPRPATTHVHGKK